METQPTVSKHNEIVQLDNMNLLYDIRKIKCELIFFNKNKNPIFFNEIKNMLTEEINTVNSFNYQDDHKSFYLKYIERDSKDIDEQKDYILNSNTCIYIFLTIMSPSLRQEQIFNFENQIDELNKMTKLPTVMRSILIFFYEKEEELLKSIELKTKYPNNIFYVKTNLKKIDLKKIETENQLTMIIKQIVLNGYIVCIQQKERPKDKIKYNKYTLDYIKTSAGEYLQISDGENALAIVEKGIAEYSYDEKGRWEEVKALMMFYSDSKRAQIAGKQMEFNPMIIELMEDARKRYKKKKKYECHV